MRETNILAQRIIDLALAGDTKATMLVVKKKFEWEAAKRAELEAANHGRLA